MKYYSLFQCFLVENTRMFCPYLSVSCNHLITQNGPQDSLHFEAGLDQAACCCNHTGSQRSTDADSTQIFQYVWCQSEWNRAVGIKITCITHNGIHAQSSTPILPVHYYILVVTYGLKHHNGEKNRSLYPQEKTKTS